MSDYDNDLPNDDDVLSEPSAAVQRNAHGHFLPGNAPGPGRPSLDAEKTLLDNRRLLNGKLSKRLFEDNEIDAVLDKLFDLAKKGSIRAIRLILEYGVGKPADYGEEDGSRPKLVAFLLEGGDGAAPQTARLLTGDADAIAGGVAPDVYGLAFTRVPARSEVVSGSATHESRMPSDSDEGDE